MRAAVLVALLACKREPAPPVFGIAAELAGPTSLVAGTTRFALVIADRWYGAEAGALVENTAASEAIAALRQRHGTPVEMYLGKTPILIAGEEHHEEKLRIAPAPVAIDTHFMPAKIATLADGRELWSFTDELVSRVMLDLVPIAPLARIGTLAGDLSPVRKKLCARPQVQDIAASPTTGYALVVECDDAAPRRLLAVPGSETQLPSRAELPLAHELLAISRDDAILVGVQDGKLAIVRAGKPARYGAATRVLAAVVADDGAIWTLAIGADVPSVARDGVPVAVAAPTGLARDATFGVVVLAGRTLYAERPPATPLRVP